MRFLILSVLTLAFTTSLPDISRSGWGPQGCGPVGPSAMASQPVFVSHIVDGWYEGASTHGIACQYEYKDGRIVAGWQPSVGIYRTFDGAKWSAPLTPPWSEKLKGNCPCCGDECKCKEKKCDKPACECVKTDCPCCGISCACASGKLCKRNCPCVVEKPVKYEQVGGEVVQNFGMDRKEDSPKERWSLSGVVVDPQVVRSAIGDNVPDDGAKHVFTVVCADKAKRETVLKDFNTAPQLAVLRNAFRQPKGYAPDHFHLKPFKLDQDDEFKKTGLALLVQSPKDKDGKAEVFPFHEYKGAEELAWNLASVDTLRDVDPNYNPNKKKPNIVPDNPLAGVPQHAWWIGGLVLLAVVLFKLPTKGA